MRIILSALFVAALVLPAAAAPLVAGPTEAFVLLNNASAFKEKSLGTLEWQEALTVGDKVTLLSGVIKAKYNGAERDYYKCKLPSGGEGFVRTILLGVGGTLGVIKVETSYLYSEPRDVKITERTLSRAQLVVVPKDGATDTFIPLTAYDEGKDAPVALSYVSKSDVSINDIDVNAVILLTVAKAQKNPVLKKNLLTVASTKYSTSLFIDLVNAQLNGPALRRATKPASGTFVVNSDKVNLRDQPNEKASKVVGTVDSGKAVEITEVTSDNYTVDGVTAPWYHLKDPDSWVFGSFLTAQ